MMTAQRVDRLLRSLVGVADLRLVWYAHGTLRAVHIVRDAGVQPHQLIRNVVSGLKAGFGIQLQVAQVHVHEDALPLLALDLAAAQVLVQSAGPDGEATSNGDGAHAHQDAAHPRGAQRNGAAHGNGNGGAQDGGRADAPANGNGALVRDGSGSWHWTSGHGRAKRNGGHGSADGHASGSYAIVNRGRQDHGGAHGNGNGHADGDSAHNGNGNSRPAANGAAAHDLAGLHVERVDVERRAGMIRCRTVLALRERRYSAIAEVPDSPSAEAELAARVAIDALRAGGLAGCKLDGVGFITVADTNYVVVTVRDAATGAPRATVAPLVDSMAAAATSAALAALHVPADTRARATRAPAR